MTRFRRSFWLVPAASPAILPLLLILQYGVNFHGGDEWEPDIAGFYVKVYTHQATFADLFAQHNEHRPAVPRLCYLLLNTFTHWNNLGQLLATWVVVGVVSLCVLRLGIATARGLTGGAIWLWFICNLLIFTPAQTENWMWGIGLANVLPTAFVFLGLVVALSARSLRTRLILCLLLASAATYSDGDGMLAWPILAAALLWSESKEGRKFPAWLWIAWAAAGALNVGLYFTHYARPPVRGIVVYSSDPVRILQYFLAFLGNGLVLGMPGPAVRSATILGTAMFVLWLAAAGYFIRAGRAPKREVRDRMFVWLLAGAYAVMSGALAAASRAGAGPLHAAMTTRYISYSIYLPVSLVHLLPTIADDLKQAQTFAMRKIWHAVPGTVISLILLVHLLGFGAADIAFRVENIRQRQAKGSLLLAGVLPDNPELAREVCSNPALLIAQARALSDLGYLQPPLISRTDAQAIHPADGVPAVIGRLDAAGVQNGTAEVVGWAIVPRNRALADSVFLTYQDDKQASIIFAPAQMGLQRPDLIDEHGPDFLWSGWLVDFPVAQIPAQIQDIHLTAWALDSDTGQAYPLDGAGRLPR